MKKIKLIIGNKKYSSWSFRPWLLLKVAGIPFTEKKLWIRLKNSYKEIRRYSPGGRVPVLLDGEVTVWESLAICEYLAEKFSEKCLWPEDPRARALAKSISHEMHAGFQSLRQHLPCHFVARYKSFPIAPEAKADIQRILEIWTTCRRKWGRGGRFLFGRFSVADAMFAPVVFRFFCYGVTVDAVSRDYMNAISSLPASKAWVREAAKEKPVISAYEFNLDRLGRHE